MKSPQQFVWDWAFANNHHVFTNLDKEKYWLVWTDEKYKVWNFEHNSLSNVPDRDYILIKNALSKGGYKFYAD